MKTSMSGSAEKVVMVGMLDRGTRQVRTKLVPNLKRETLQKELLDRVGFGATLYTDGSPDITVSRRPSSSTNGEPHGKVRVRQSILRALKTFGAW